MKQSVKDINIQIKQCTFCRLHETRNKAVCGEGIIPSKFMFIAQAPGRTEDKESKILIGPSGKIFDQLVSFVGLSRNEIFITNLLKCFLPKCRRPRRDEMETCYELYLKKEIELVKPEIIVLLGYHVTKFFFRMYNLKVPNKFNFKSCFGNLYIAKNKKIISLRHPATVVHKSKPINKLQEEYKILKTIQNHCRFIKNCSQFNKYESGLVPIDFVEQYCFGNWEKCTFLNQQYD